MHFHKPISVLLACALLSTNLFAQSVDTTMLCRGNYFTEAEGKAALEQFGSTYNDLKGWKKRADRIRQGIKDGMNLPNNFKRTPLKPIIHSKRVYDGYTVENVA